MKRLFSTIITVLIFSFASFAQKESDPETVKRIDTYLNELEKVGFSGSVLIELNGNKVISKGYGFSDQEKQIKNDANTIFDIGSITKQFTAAAILKLEMQKKLSTNDKITKYFNNVPADKSNITIHDLLRHQTGLKSNVGKDYEPITQDAFLDSLMHSKLQFEVGGDFSYSNIGYSLLAMIVEKVSGQSYESYLYENLFKPAGMEMTGYSRPAFDKSKIAIGYFNDDRVWGRPNEKEWDGKAPYWHLKGNGGILSTTEDMFKWHQALMGDKILSNEAKAKLYHPKIRANESYKGIYAYGWDVMQTPRNTRRVAHNGSNRIFYADFMRFIDEGTTLIMLSNKAHENFNDLNFEISRMIFQKDYNPVIPIADNKANREFTQQIIETVSNSGLEAGKIAYEKRGTELNLLESMLNQSGYDYMRQKDHDKAIAVFIMNTYAFPKSANTFDSLGEAYMNKGNKTLAIENYKKSLELNPDNGNAKDMLEELNK